jgi:hypothetical protein
MEDQIRRRAAGDGHSFLATSAWTRVLGALALAALLWLAAAWALA